MFSFRYPPDEDYPYSVINEWLVMRLAQRLGLDLAEALYAEVKAENAQIVQRCPELSATLAGELRCIRDILHTVLKEMTKQIA